jgi:hypothetical protein
VEKDPQTNVPLDDRRDILNLASEIVNAVAPEIIEERRRELDEMEKKDRRNWRFWRR